MAGEHDVPSWLPIGASYVTREIERNDPDLSRMADLVECLPGGNDTDRVGWWPEKGILGTEPGPNHDEQAW